VIAVAAVVVVAGLLGASVLLSPSASAAPPTFDEARTALAPVVANVSTGGWTLLGGFGLDERSGSTIEVAEVVATMSTNCTPGAVPGYSLPASVHIPAYAGSFGAGTAPFWTLLYRQSTDGPYLIATDTAGAVVPVAYLVGASCASSLASVKALPGTFVDSPVVAKAAWSGTANASEFVEGDPAIDTLALLATGSLPIDGYSFSGWGLEYAPCPLLLADSTVSETTYDVAFSPAGAYDGAVTSHTDCPAT